MGEPKHKDYIGIILPQKVKGYLVCYSARVQGQGRGKIRANVAYFSLRPAPNARAVESRVGPVVGGLGLTVKG